MSNNTHLNSDSNRSPSIWTVETAKEVISKNHSSVANSPQAMDLMRSYGFTEEDIYSLAICGASVEMKVDGTFQSVPGIVYYDHLDSPTWAKFKSNQRDPATAKEDVKVSFW